MTGMVWPKVRLADVCIRVTDGTHQSPRFETSGIPFLVISNVVTGEIDWGGVTKWVSPATYEVNTERCRPERGDVLYTAVGSFGIAVPVETDQQFMFQRHIAHIKPDPSRLHTRFLAHMLNSPATRAFAAWVAKGVAQKTVTLGALKEFAIPLPPLREQRRIADILDKADAIRRKRQEAIALTDELLRSTFLEMFGDPVTNPKGWPVRPLGDLLARPLQNGAYFPKERYCAEGDLRGTEMVHMSDAFQGVVARGSLRRVEIDARVQALYGLGQEDILVARRSLTYDGSAKPCRIPLSIAPLIFESSLIRVTPRASTLTPRFLFAYLSNERARKEYVLPNVTQSTISGINQAGLERISVLLPPLQLQHKFEQKWANIEATQTRLRNALADAKVLLSSLVHHSFGESTLS